MSPRRHRRYHRPEPPTVERRAIRLRMPRLGRPIAPFAAAAATLALVAAQLAPILAPSVGAGTASQANGAAPTQPTSTLVDHARDEHSRARRVVTLDTPPAPEERPPAATAPGTSGDGAQTASAPAGNGTVAASAPWGSAPATTTTGGTTAGGSGTGPSAPSLDTTDPVLSVPTLPQVPTAPAGVPTLTAPTSPLGSGL